MVKCFIKKYRVRWSLRPEYVTEMTNVDSVMCDLWISAMSIYTFKYGNQ